MVDARRFGSGPPLVALHGFTFTGEQFSSMSSILGRMIIAPDLPGHGLNTHAPTALTDAVHVVASSITSAGSPVPVIGYSQGGRVALMTALERPADISALVVVSATAGIEDTHERTRRAESDAELANRLTTMTIDQFLNTWTTAGITSTEHLSEAERTTDTAIRRENSPQGLAHAVTGYGQGAQPSLWHRLSDLPMPVLVMSGLRDTKYSAIAERMADLIPCAELSSIDHAGHNPIADAPGEAYAAISAFLDRNS